MDKPVSFESGKLLKEKGFDIPVRNYYLLKDKGGYLHEGFEDDYWGDNRILNWNSDVNPIKPFRGFISAPTIAEVVMWLYEKHGIWIYVDSHEFGKWCYSTKFNRPHELYPRITENGKFGLEDYNSPTEAYEAAIKHVLKEFKTLI